MSRRSTFVPMPAMVTGNITAADVSGGGTTASLTSGSYVECDTVDYNMVTLQFSGTYGSVAIAYEWSLDETIWHTARGYRNSTITVETASGTQTNISRIIKIPTDGARKFRVRCTAYTSGTMAIKLQRSNCWQGWGGFTLT